MLNWYRTVTILAVLPWVLLALAASKVKPVEVRVSPRFGMAGGTLTVTIRVEPDERNRLIEWVVDSDGWATRSGATISPDDLPTRTVRYRLPAGHYRIVAFLTRSDATTHASTVAEACFAGDGVSC